MRVAVAAALAARALVAALVCAGAAACAFGPAVPPGAHVDCVKDSDCPPDLPLCLAGSGRCVADAAVDQTAASASFAPAEVKDGDTVTLTVTFASLDLAAPPTLVFTPFDPGFSVSSSGSDGFTWTAVIDEAGADRSFRLVALRVDGGATIDINDVGFFVDNRPPSVTITGIRGGLADSGDPPLFSDLAGSNAIEVDVDASEGTPTASLGRTALACSAASAPLAWVCTGSVSADADDTPDNGATAIVASVSDAAGNASLVTEDARTDFVPPAVVAGSEVITAAGAADVVLAGSSAVIRFVTSEPLASAPVLQGLDGIAVLSSWTAVGTNQTLQLDTAGGAADGQYPIGLTIGDVVGHSDVVVLSIPLHIATAIAAPCTALDAAGAPACTDFDGDGVVGPGPNCFAAVLDCDDTNPLVSPSILEIPGDGLDNDCAGDGDLPLDATTGVIASPSGTGSGDSLCDPASLADAMNRATAESRAVLALEGDYALDFVIHASIVGGLRADPPGAPCASQVLVHGALRSHLIGIADTFIVDSPASLTNIETGTLQISHSGIVVAHSAVDVRVDAPALFVDDDFVDADHGDMPVREGVFLDSRFTVGIEVLGTGSSFIRDVIANEIELGPNGQTTFVDTAVVNGATSALHCAGCLGATLVHSSIFGGTNNFAFAGSPGTFVVVNSLIHLEPAAASVFSFDTSDGVRVAFGNVFDVPSTGALWTSASGTFAADAAGLAAFEDCAAQPGACGGAAQNHLGTAGLSGDGRGHIVDNSAAIDRGVANPVALVGSLVDVPTAVAGDIDGQCRFVAGAPDAGLDEH